MKKNDLNEVSAKYSAVQTFIDKGIISFEIDRNQVSIHYLLWHSFSESGINKMLHSIWFWAMEQLAFSGKKVTEWSYEVFVNYAEMNEYHEIGKLSVGKYDGKHLN